MNDLIQSLKDKGYQVFGPCALTTYVWFTNGVNIGYVQIDRLEGIRYSSVHKANKYTGTGFIADGAEDALSYVPSWVSHTERVSIVKFKDMEEFIAKHWQALVQY